MQVNYCVIDQTRQEIITKTPIPNNGKFNFFATCHNLIDSQGIGFQICSDSDIEVEKLY